MNYSHVYTNTIDEESNYLLFEDGSIHNFDRRYYLTEKYKPIIENVNPEKKFVFSFKKKLPFNLRLDFNEEDLKSRFIKCYYPDLDLIILERKKPDSNFFKVAYMYQYTDQGIFSVTVQDNIADISFITFSDNDTKISVISNKVEFIGDIREGLFIPKQMNIKDKISITYSLISIEDIIKETNYKYALGYDVINIRKDDKTKSFISKIESKQIANCCIYIENNKFVFNYDSRMTVVSNQKDQKEIPYYYEMKSLNYIKTIREIEEDLRNEK